jgi:GT2 family glycosyltransferase
MNKPICVIVTTFNRREITHRFLISIEEQLGKCNFPNTIILVDDSSNDGTPEMVSKEFPDIILLKGTGHLYWAGGVRLAINYLGDSLNKFRGILLINDDVVLADESIASITKIAEEYGGLIGGTVVTHSGEIESTGGTLGRLCKPKQRLRIANGLVQNCDLLSGHVLYIPMKVYKSLGGFDVNLPYRFIDLEFSLRAKRAGIPVLLAPKIVAFTDEVHNYFKETSSMRGSFSELIQGILLHPKGPHWRESVYYLKKVSPRLWWLWLPFYYRAFFVALIRSYLEKFSSIRK